MTKRIAVLLGAVAMLAAVAVQAQVTGPAAETVRRFAAALHKAEGLNASMTIQVVGGTRRSVNLQLSKPNLARVDTPEKLIVADGEKVTFYDKSQKVYFTRKQTAEELAKALGEQELGVFMPFFDEKAVDGMFRTAKAEPNANRKGVEYQVVSVTLAGATGKSMKLYLRKDDGIIRLAELTTGAGANAQITVIDATNLTLAKPAGEGTFAFKAPDGSKEVKEAELVAFKWYTDLEEAKTVAKATGRKLMLDFWFDG